MIDIQTGMKIFLLPVLFFLLLLFSQPLCAKTSADFSPSELSSIKQKYGQIHINLIADYHKTMTEYRQLPAEKQLIMVNNYLNTLLPEHDSVRNKQEEYWSTPKEFWRWVLATVKTMFQSNIFR